jgi:hypothetical protein
MRKREYLSPTQVMLWKQDKEEYYVKSDTPPPKFKQTKPMSVGSAFDAYAKAAIANDMGIEHNGQFDFETIFELQVEEHNRDWARDAGQWAFKCYVESGAYASLVKMLDASEFEARMEFTEKGTVTEKGLEGSVGDVVLLGKPDLWWVLDNGASVIHDWKVNGFCSKASPAAGYVNIRAGWGSTFYRDVKKMRGNNMPHKDCAPMFEEGIEINMIPSLEKSRPNYALQTATYSWLLGAEVGSEIIVSIDQLVCDSQHAKACCDQPLIRVAQHRCNISQEFQLRAYADYQRLWDSVHNGYPDIPDSRKKILDNMAAALAGEDDKTVWLREALGR